MVKLLVAIEKQKQKKNSNAKRSKSTFCIAIEAKSIFTEKGIGTNWQQ